MKDWLGYADKVCVVTGSSSGMGRAVVESLVSEGAKVYGLDRNPSDTQGITFIQTDLADKFSIDEAFSQIPDHIDCFFGVAGLSGAKTGYWTTFTVNFIANKYITDRYLTERMEAGGAILYVTSCGGLMWEKWSREYKKVMKCRTWEEMEAFMKKVSPKDGVGIMAYTLSKRAMNYYASLMAVELGARGIRVNAVLPGSTDTGMKAEFEKMAGGADKLAQENGAVGRLATSQEMADPIVYLNSNMASFVSGLMMVVDMGHNAAKVLGLAKNQLNVPAALPLYNTKFMQKKFREQI
ncbi:MAG: SDR family oxidoreductase [Coriobacteriales bacterium]|nr:SDR family oxidoreductase [Coriobacteriales bacterium]